MASTVSQETISDIKSMFQVLDKDADGVVSKEDLSSTLASLGKSADQDYLDQMMKSVPKPITMSTFILYMSNMLKQPSSRSTLMNAFMTFDTNDSGRVSLNELCHSLSEQGVKLQRHEIESAAGAFSDTTSGIFNYRQWVETISKS